jgi:hypothetical protein
MSFYGETIQGSSDGLRSSISCREPQIGTAPGDASHGESLDFTNLELDTAVRWFLQVENAETDGTPADFGHVGGRGPRSLHPDSFRKMSFA